MLVVILIISILDLIFTFVLLNNWLSNNQNEYIDTLVTDNEILRADNENLRKQIIELAYKEID